MQVIFEYVENLKISLGKCLRFLIPSAITPRYSSENCKKTLDLLNDIKNFNFYNPDELDIFKRDVERLQKINDSKITILNPIKKKTLKANLPKINANSEYIYPWNIKISVKSNSDITFIKCPNHKVDVFFFFLILKVNIIPGNDGKSLFVELDPNDLHIPNKDFELLYSKKNMHIAQNILYYNPSTESYLAKFSFVPDFNDVKSETKESLQKGEYIFLIDRSGSMYGEKMEIAKESLIFFLKSLPSDCYYNIVNHFINNIFFIGKQI